MEYDSKCADLARYFLHDTKLDVDAHLGPLAEAIQEAVEDYLQLQEAAADSKAAPEE